MSSTSSFVVPRIKATAYNNRKRRKSLPDMTSARLPRLGQLAATQREPNYDPTHEESTKQESLDLKPRYGTMSPEESRIRRLAIFGSPSPAF